MGLVAHGPFFQIAGGAEESDLAAFELEDHVFEGDGAFAGLGACVVEIVRSTDAGYRRSRLRPLARSYSENFGLAAPSRRSAAMKPNGCACRHPGRRECVAVLERRL